MKATSTLRAVLTWLAILAPFTYLAYLWPQLPARVPTHFDAAGEINGYGSKYTTLLLAGIPLLAWLIQVVAPRLDPKRRLDADAANYQKLMLSLAIGLSAVSGVALYATRYQHLPANGLELALCLLFVLMGNYLTTVRPNYFIGIRTPWTLESESVWARTHRLAGRLFFWGGLLAAGLVLLVPVGAGVWVVVGLVLVTSFTSYAYSYFAYRQEVRRAALL